MSRGLILERGGTVVDSMPDTWTLGSDDNTPADEHISAATAALTAAQAAIDQAFSNVNAAFSSLSHIKVESP